MDLKTFVKETRKEKGMTQKEFASLLGVTNVYISNIEKGKFEPGKPFLERLSYALKVPYALILVSSLTEDSFISDKKETFKNIKPILDSLIKQLL